MRLFKDEPLNEIEVRKREAAKAWREGERVQLERLARANSGLDNVKWAKTPGERAEEERLRKIRETEEKLLVIGDVPFAQNPRLAEEEERQIRKLAGLLAPEEQEELELIKQEQREAEQMQADDSCPTEDE